MIENRLTQWYAESQGVAPVSFVPCPMPIMAAYTPSQLAFVEEVYRRARALLEVQFQPPPRPRPEFSVN